MGIINVEWDFFGFDRRESFEKELDPENLSYELKRYQKALGKEFGLTELLEMKKIQSFARIAEAINDLPEFFVHQIGKAEKCGVFSTFSGGLEAIADAIQESNE